MSEPSSLDILLVEDEAAHAELIRRALELDPALRLRVESDLASARKHLESRLPDLLIVDSTLPDGRGLELLEDLDRMAAKRSLPTILLTSHHEPRLEEEAREAGIFRYLAKTPESLFEMSSHIREILDDWRHENP